MSEIRKIKSALISVYHKEGLEPVIHSLHQNGVTLYATGGTRDFIEKRGVPVIPVEDLTDYPSILGGRVKTLHPKVFGGILSRRENAGDVLQLDTYQIPSIDLVVVDLYPFEDTVASGAGQEDIIEKIDIGGISLIRAGAKNYRDVLIISSMDQYAGLLRILEEEKGETGLGLRKSYAALAFGVSSHYDTAIFNYFSEGKIPLFRKSYNRALPLRYGENPHQHGIFFGALDRMLEQLGGKELSYNNLLDIDAGISLMADFEDTTFAIIKHNNACGVASAATLIEAWTRALACDPVSAFGGILITNRKLTADVAAGIHKLFFEVLIAPAYDPDALALLKEKKNRILLLHKPVAPEKIQFRSLLNGVIQQEKDLVTETVNDMKPVTSRVPSATEYADLVFANKLVKHTRSNTIVLVKNACLLASGTGQTSRVDALQQAIDKAGRFHFGLEGAVMASDAFFPFPDCVEIAHQAGITAVIQPGGSIRDQESVDYCNKNGLAMVITGNRHFKH